jgi:hypothetical protein
MKFNWGTGIIIVSLLFMSFIVMLVVKTYKLKVDLVSEDYYSQELAFQDRIDKMNNVKSNLDKVIWNVEANEIVFQFPTYIVDTSITGTIEFFRPSDSDKDLIIPIQIDQAGKQHVRKAQLYQGLYKLKIDWSTNHKGYYMEEDVFIQ